MRTIQEMRLIKNLQEEEGGAQRVNTQSPLVPEIPNMGLRQSTQAMELDAQSVLEYDLTDSDDEGSPNRVKGMMPLVEGENSPQLGSSMKKQRGARLHTRMSASSSKGAQKMVEAV